ncbi:transcription elongation factor, partial [Vibrio parahaemolyticus]|nr:transcription elongation factor [Vibrio parahaemolyticus]
MNKADLVQIIIQHLEEKLQVAHSSAQRAIDAATDEETVPEHKYDTLALEAAYLAHGQAMRIQDSEEELRQYR